MIPVVHDSYIVQNDSGATILRQEGRAGLWFLKRGFTVTFRVREVPGAYIGFESIAGDFRRFEGHWQIQEREGGTWVAHTVRIQPAFFAPRWAMGHVARDIMRDTIEGVIERCLSGNASNLSSEKIPSPRQSAGSRSPSNFSH
jgi:ribosome-associated toxin RatA of RatAB toxin-antitoxin module